MRTLLFLQLRGFRITNVAVSPARRVAFSFLGRDDEGRIAQGIGWLSAAGEVEQILRTDGYIPQHVSFAPDGSLWAQGQWSLTDVLAHYDESGALIQEWDISGEEGANFGWLPTAVFPIEDRVGIIMDQKRLWVEIAPDGTPIGQWPIPGGYEVTGAALTAEGDAYVLVGRKATAEYQPDENLIFRLDRSNGEWTTIEYDHLKETGDPGGVELHGALGDGVIIRVNDRGFLTVRPTVSR